MKRSHAHFRTLSKRRKRRVCAPSGFRRLRFEPLESRWLLSITVNTLVDENDGTVIGGISLRDAIAAASSGETINFAASLTSGGPATILLTHGELLVTKSLTINGPGAILLTIDASGNDPTPLQNNGDGSRVFNIDNADSTLLDVTIRDLTLTGADTAGSGGAISSSENLTLENCTITGNSAGIQGGAISSVSAHLTVTGCNIIANVSAEHGGGIDTNFTDAEITSTTIADNTAGNHGGGLSFGAGQIHVADSQITGNLTDFGGGIWNYGTLTVERSTISGNTARESGGGLGTNAVITLTNSTISGNFAFDRGGGVYVNSSSTAVLANNTITANTSDSDQNGNGSGGGAFHSGSGSFDVRNTIIAANKDNSGVAPDVQLGTSPATISFSLIGDNTGSGLAGASQSNNLIGDPLVGGVIDPMLGALGSNGGPTKTHALLAGSPAINAGDPNFVAPPDFDQRGAGFPRVLGGRIDIGAFERANQPPVANDDTATVNSGAPRPIFPLGNDADADGQLTSVTVATPPTHGTLTNEGDFFTYKSAPGYVGPDSFQYTATDDQLDVSNVATVTITVAANQLPIAENDSFVVGTGLTEPVPILSNDSDPDGDIVPTSIVITLTPIHGTVTVDSNGLVSYQSASGYLGPDTFRYKVSDDSGEASNEATVNLSVRKALVITPYDTSTPTSILTSALIQNGNGLSNISASFTGATGQAGTFSNFDLDDGTTSLSMPDGIILTSGDAPSVAPPNTSNSDDRGLPGDSDLDTLGVSTLDACALTIQFTASADTKGIEFDLVFGSQEFPVFVGRFNDIFGAFLDGVQISFDSNHQPLSVNNNFFQLNNSGDSTDPDTFGKTPVALRIHYNGLTPRLTTQATLDSAVTVHTLKLVIADAVDRVVDSGIFLANLRGIVDSGGGTGDPPTASAGGPYAVGAGGSVQLDASGSSDPDQATNTLSFVWDLDGDGSFGETGSQAANGDETGISPTFSAVGLAAGTYTVKVQVTDATNLVSSSQSTVTFGNVAPTAHDDTADTIQNSAVTIDVLDNDSDSDGTINTASVTIVGAASHGTTSVAPTTGLVTYKPNSNYSGTDSFTYRVNDNSGTSSNIATVSINVGALHTLTTGTGDGNVTLTVDGFGSFGSDVFDQDVDAVYDPLGTIGSSSTTFQSGIAIRIGSTGSRQFLTSGDIGDTGDLTAPNIVGSALSATSTFSFGGLTFVVTQTVTPLFDALNKQTGAMLTQTYVVSNSGASPIDFELLRYIDGDLEFDNSISDGGGRIVSVDHEFLFETDAGGSGATDTTFLGIDALGGKIPDTNRFEVDQFSGLQSRIVNGDPLDDIVTGDGDSDGFVDPGAEFDVALALRNLFSLLGGASTTYTSRTVFGSGSPEDVTTPPVANDDLATTDSNTPAVIDLIGNDSDADGTIDPTSVTIVGTASHGTLSIDPTTGAATYKPSSNYSGPDSFTYKVKDNSGAFSNVATVSITVKAPNNVPPIVIAPNGNQSILEGDKISFANLATFTESGFAPPESFTFDVNWGDGRDAILGAAVMNVNSDATQSSGTISGSHIYAADGTYTVKITVHDNNGGSGFALFTVTVTNVAPKVETKDPKPPEKTVPNDKEPKLQPVRPPDPIRVIAVDSVKLERSVVGAGGTVIFPPRPSTPPAASVTSSQTALQRQLPSPRTVSQQELVDKVYALGDFELVSLVGFDMGDEPVAPPPNKPKPPDPVLPGKGETVVVNKPTIDDLGEPVPKWSPWALWSALAGGTMWLSGTWWWKGRKRARFRK